MAASFPYSLISCPCDSEDDLAAATALGRRSTLSPRFDDDGDDDETDKTLNPHDPRSDLSLHPYNRLLYCDECHQIRCSKCWAEETTTWYCPSCLFEVPSSVVKNDGSRCTRNCYNCPLCTSPLSINALEQQASSADAPVVSGPFFLACPHCEWSSLDVGIEFDKPTKITEQLLRMRKNGSASSRPAESPESSSKNIDTEHEAREQANGPIPSSEHKFARLSKFYKDQLSTSDAAAATPMGLDASYSSPTNLARIMQIYGGLSASSLKRAKEKPKPMREALTKDEGLFTFVPERATDASDPATHITISQTATYEQRFSHPWNHSARLTSDLWPVPTLLKLKTSKRCRACRHILIRHDDSRSKTSSSSSSSTSRYKIRLLAQNRIPRLSLRPFNASAPVPAATPLPRAAFALTPAAVQALTASDNGLGALRPFHTKQFLLVVVNPLFETVRVSLATPQLTPGKVASRVTILCPSFDVGPDGDMWDSALDGGGGGDTSASSSRRDAGGARERRGGDKGLAGGAGQFRARGTAAEDAEAVVPEAGKVWERGRNWVAVVVEVVPGSLEGETKDDAGEDEDYYDDWVEAERRRKRERSLRDDILMIPVFVKAEWEAESTGEEAAAAAATTSPDAAPSLGKGGKVKREIGFWCVLGAGRIAP